MWTLLWTFLWTSKGKPSWAVSSRHNALGRLPGSGESEEGHLGNEAASAQADHRELAPGYQLVGEGPGDPEQFGRLAHAVDETFRRERFIWLRRVQDEPLLFEGSDRHSLPIEGQFARRFWTSSRSGATRTSPNQAEIVTIPGAGRVGHDRDSHRLIDDTPPPAPLGVTHDSRESDDD